MRPRSKEAAQGEERRHYYMQKPNIASTPQTQEKTRATPDVLQIKQTSFLRLLATKNTMLVTDRRRRNRHIATWMSSNDCGVFH